MTTTPTLDQMLAEAVEALQAIALALDGERDRLGRLQNHTTNNEPLRALRIKLECGMCVDNIDGSVHVARAVLARIMLGASARVDASASRF
jgi:hypothetical protein